MKRFVTTMGATTLCALAASASAQPQSPPAPYSLPWQLRPAVPVSVLRSDTAVALHDDAAGKPSYTAASMLLFSYKVTRDFAPFVRLGLVGSPQGTVITNPAFGATYGIKLGRDLRLAFFLGLTAPVGMGGGDRPNPDHAAVIKLGVPARSAMDNAMFAVNDLTVFPGLGLAYVAHGLTVQIEATVLELIRARGAAVQKDAAKTNFTAGLHVGYFFIPQLSIGAELRYQRWLTTPAMVAADPTGALRDTLSVAVGPRVHIRLARNLWLRPGLAYARGLDRPMAGADYNILQIDVPLVF